MSGVRRVMRDIRDVVESRSRGGGVMVSYDVVVDFVIVVVIVVVQGGSDAPAAAVRGGGLVVRGICNIE